MFSEAGLAGTGITFSLKALMESSSGISIVIPAYNEALFLPKTLESVNSALDYFRKIHQLPGEIIVINNMSTDKTKEVATNFGANVFDFERRNIAAVRNEGIKRARYNIIFAIDADCTISKDSLSKTWNYMQDRTLVGAALGVDLVSVKLTHIVITKLIQALVRKFSGIEGAMFVFRKKEALSLGGFPEDRLVAEDSAFSFRMQEYANSTGRKFSFFKDIRVKTLDRKELHPKDLPKLALKVWKEFRGAALNKEDLDFWYDPDR